MSGCARRRLRGRRLFALACIVATAACAQDPAAAEPHIHLRVTVVLVGGPAPLGHHKTAVKVQPGIRVTVWGFDSERHEETDAAGHANFDVGTGRFRIAARSSTMPCRTAKTVDILPTTRTINVRLKCDVK